MGRKKNRWPSAQINNQTYIDYYQRLMEFAINMFEWRNLPPTVDERFLELTLYEKGYCLYFNDEVVGNLALTCTIGGMLDVYRIPTERRAFAVNGYNKICTSQDSVLIFNNYLHTPTILTIELFARRLYEIERTIDVNVKAQKTPTLVLASEQQRLTMKNLYMQYDGNEPFIFGDKDMEFDGIKCLKTDAPYVADKLQVLKHQIWNEALTFCGIENSNQDKKERLVADEVGSNYGNIEAQRNVMLNARRQAADKINRMFGTNIEVGFRSSLNTMVNSENVSRETFEGVDEDESLYNASQMDS
ncbi:MAG: hypothetical protein J6C92_12355 [Bacteroidaceae bacterium]|jgi:hypothetical protein|nr:hypothetical protein [Bacteroidaceae bacterium]DAW59530.1 MAG TPA: upper collar protein [Caudoviricetes sp.]